MPFQLFPTAPQIGTAVIHSSATGYNSGHYGDIAYFDKTGRKNRKLAIRTKQYGEFAFADEPLDAPQGWVLVIRVSSDTHIVVFIYRGRNFFAMEGGYAKVSSDFDAVTIAIECFRRNGVDPEIAKFLAGLGS